MQVFTSFATADREKAAAIQYWLENEIPNSQIRVYDRDREASKGPEGFRDQFSERIQHANKVLILYSSNWLQATVCWDEYRLANEFGRPVTVVAISDDYGAHPDAYKRAFLDHAVALKLFDNPPLTDKVYVDPLTAEKKKIPVNEVELARLLGFAAGQDGLGGGAIAPSTKDVEAYHEQFGADEVEAFPYRGLYTYTEKHSAVFFGREEERAEAVRRLRASRREWRAFFVNGYSGSGKSSFMRAGLIPDLKRLTNEFVVLPPVNPESADAVNGPTGLIAAVNTLVDSSSAFIPSGYTDEPFKMAERIHTALSGYIDRIGLEPWKIHPTTRRLDGPTVIIPIDQAEALQKQRLSPKNELLLAVLSQLRNKRGIYCAVCSVRDTFQTSLRRSMLGEDQNWGDYALDPIRGEVVAERIIRGPLHYFKGPSRPQLRDELVRAIRTDFSSDKDGNAVALLSFTLRQLFEKNRHADQIFERQYKALGGLKGSIAYVIEEAMQLLESRDRGRLGGHDPRDILRRLILYKMTKIDDANAGVTSGRPILGKRPIAQRDLSEVELLVASVLVEKRVFSVREAASGRDQEAFEIAHIAFLENYDPISAELNDLVSLKTSAALINRLAADWVAETNPAESEKLLGLSDQKLQHGLTILADPNLEGELNPEAQEFIKRVADKKKVESKSLEELQKELESFKTLNNRMVEEIGTFEDGAAQDRKRVRTKFLAGTAVAVFAIGAGAWVWTNYQQTQSDLKLRRLDAQIFFDASRDAHRAGNLRLARKAFVAAVRTMPRDEALDPDMAQLGQTVLGVRMEEQDSSAKAALGSGTFGAVYGNVIAASRAGRRIGIWDTHSGNHRLDVELTWSPPFFVAADDAAMVAYPDQQSWVVVNALDVEQGAAVTQTHLTGLELRAQVIAITRDGSRVAAVDQGRRLFLWDVASKRPIWNKRLNRDADGDSDVSSMNFSPDGRMLAVGRGSGRIEFYSVEQGDFINDIAGADEPVLRSAISPSGRWLVPVVDRTIADVWDTSLWKRIDALRGHSGRVTAVAFNPKNEAEFVTGGADGLLIFRKIEESRADESEKVELWRSGATVTKLLFDQSGSNLIVFEATGGAGVYSLKDRSLVGVVTEPGEVAIGFAEDRDQLIFVVVTRDERIVRRQLIADDVSLEAVRGGQCVEVMGVDGVISQEDAVQAPRLAEFTARNVCEIEVAGDPKDSEEKPAGAGKAT